MNTLTITTSRELSPEKKFDIETKLQRKYGYFKAIYRVDQAILGGIIIFDGQTAYDGSLKTQLAKLRDKVVDKIQQ